MQHLSAEFLIVGSGPAGVSAAWPLVEAGRDVLMIDSASTSVPLAPGPNLSQGRRRPDWMARAFGLGFQSFAPDTATSPKHATARGRAVLGGGAKTTPPVTADDFVYARADNVGGLSTIWGAACSAFDAQDLQAFPLAPEDLAPSYRAVAQRIGISGAADGLGAFHGDMPLQPPSALTAPLALLLQSYEARRAAGAGGFTLGKGRNAILTLGAESRQDGRKPCIRCGLCLYGCERGSIFDAGYEVSALSAFPNFRYRPGSRADRIIRSTADTQRLAVETSSGGIEIEARKTLLAAGTLNTTALILDYKQIYDREFPLLSNPVAAMACLSPRFFGEAFPAETMSLAQLSFRLGLSGGDYATGSLYGADALPLSMMASRMPFSRAAALHLSAALAPAVIFANCFLPGSFSHNQVTLRKTGQGVSLQIKGAFRPDIEAVFDRCRRELTKSLRQCGVFSIPGSFKISPPGGDLHHVGTIPMGGDGPLACDRLCEVADMPGIHVIDGAWFSALPAKHCTFTIMANADRVSGALLGLPR